MSGTGNGEITLSPASMRADEVIEYRDFAAVHEASSTSTLTHVEFLRFAYHASRAPRCSTRYREETHAKRYRTCVRHCRRRASRRRQLQRSGARTSEDEARTAAGLSTTIPILARHCCPR